MRILLLLLLLSPMLSVGQNRKLWTSIPVNSPTTYRKEPSFNLSTIDKAAIKSIISEVSLTGRSEITIPHPSGGESQFTIQPSNLMAKELQIKHPEIQTFKGVNKSGDKLYLDVNPSNMHGIVFSKAGTFFLDPADEGGNQYKSYFKGNDQTKSLQTDISCRELISQSELNALNEKKEGYRVAKRSNGLQLRKYRIAIAAHETFTTRTGEANALATIVTILNRANAVFENELAITMELIANNDEIIMTRSNPGPFSANGNSELLLRENQGFLDDVIGTENYDLGHVIGGAGAGGGGIASLRSVCVPDMKARGATSILFRTDNLNTLIEIFIHEIGHQFGAFHTFTSGNSCSFGVSNFHQRAAYEMGSGNTMMSYAGICGDNSVVSIRDEYFHSISIDNILDFIERPGDCSEKITTNNSFPELSIRESGFSIPINTPFVLEADATDADGDDLTYTWEQFDQATKMENRPGTPYSSVSGISYFSIEEFMESDEFYTRQELEDLVLPDGSKLDESVIEFVLGDQQRYIDSFFEGDGPLFRGFPPSENPNRYFPELSKVLAGETSIEQSVYEVLPFKTRNLNFRVTVRDNSPVGGGLTNELLSFSSAAEAGPFIVTSQFSESSYLGTSSLVLRWDVANTDAPPVNCQLVDVLYSTDGGQSFDIILKRRTANDGIENITLPNISTSEARIMVKASENVFFNVNDRNFSVEAVSSEIPESPTDLIASLADETTVNLSWKDNSDSETGFIIERKKDGESFIVLGSVTINTQSYSDENIDRASNYTYRLAAFNADGNSPYSNEAVIAAAASAETDIITFSIDQQITTTSINSTNHTVALEMPLGSDLSTLSPQIQVSPGAIISPISGQPKDFTNPVTYTVTAEDGTTTQEWIATVTIEEDNRKTGTDFVSFQLADQTKDAEISILEHKVQVEVARGTDLSTLAPSFTLSEGATSSPASGETIDFTGSGTNPVVFKITAENEALTQDWTVVVTEEIITSVSETDDQKIFPNPVKSILKIELSTDSHIQLTDLNGRILIEGLSGSNISLDLSALKDGTYLLVIIQDKQKVIRKIVKDDTGE